MKKIYSRVKPDLLTHVIYRFNDISEGRENLIPDDEFLQCSALKLSEGKTFKPHKHLIHKGKSKVKAQEAWMVFVGKVECTLYDIDDSALFDCIIQDGDVCITLHGGHNYRVLENNTLVYEFKTGPYLGVKLDKEVIE